MKDKIRFRPGASLSISLFIAVLSFRVYAEDYYVSTLGNDKDAGTKSHFFASLEDRSERSEESLAAANQTLRGVYPFVPSGLALSKANGSG